MARSNEEWERRKWYLVRSLFDNVPLPSIPEESLELRSSSEVVSRPYSPLPDLIIEKEPNRHDESEEYYQVLEKKVTKIFRKMFLKIGTSLDTSVEDAEELAFSEDGQAEDAEELIRSEYSITQLRQSDENLVSDQQSIDRAQSNEFTDLSSSDQSEVNEPVNITPTIQSGINEPANISPTSQSGINDSASISPTSQSGINEHANISPTSRLGINDPASITPTSRSGNNDPANISPTSRLGINDPASITPTSQSGINEPANISSPSRSGISEPSVTSPTEYSVNNEHSSSAKHSGCTSNSTSNKFSEDGGETKVLRKTETSGSMLEKSDRTLSRSTSLPSHEIIVAIAEIHSSGPRRTDTIANVRPASSKVEDISEEDRHMAQMTSTGKQEECTDLIERCTSTDSVEGENDYLEAELESTQSSDIQEETTEASSDPDVHSDESSLDKPEAMRRRETINMSIESNAYDDRRCSSTAFEAEDVAEHFSREMEEADECLADFSVVLGTSTPQHRSQPDDRKRRILSEIPYDKSSKRTRLQNVAIQTSYSTSDDENSWQEIRKCFFEGNPRIYNLCRCRNHVCC